MSRTLKLIIAIGVLVVAWFIFFPPFGRPGNERSELPKPKQLTALVGDTTTGLVAWWKFDDGSGTIAADSSGGGLAGTLINGPSWVTGKIAGALSFDGVDDYVVLPANVGQMGVGNFTVSAWAFNDGVNVGKTVIASRISGGNEKGYAMYFDSASSAKFLIQNGLGTDGLVRATNISAGWHHLVGVLINGQSMRIYLDGELAQETLTSVPAGDLTSPQAVRIGAHAGGSAPFKDKIDDVRIYNRALSALDVAELFAAGSGVPPPTCGNGALDAGETCDGSNLNNQTCATQGSTSGTLTCNATCSGFNTSQCVNNPPTPDTTPPTVSITAPVSGTTVSGPISISANATDNIAVAGVQFKLDGANLGAEDTADPYTMTWDTNLVANGSRTVTAVARDTSGNTAASVGVTFTISNVVLPPPPPSSWTPPIGIPRPPFGIDETHRMYEDPAARNPALTYTIGPDGPYTHYVDNTNPSATDTNNPFGTPAKPRLSIPLNLPAGSVVEVHGAYNVSHSSPRKIDGTGTPGNPIFIRGASPIDRPVITNWWYIRGHYIILENLTFGDADGDLSAGLIGKLAILSPAGHIALRHSDVTGNLVDGGLAITTFDTNTASNIVVYNNKIYDNGDWQLGTPGHPCSPDNGLGFPRCDQDSHGIKIASYVNDVWIVDNEIYHNSGTGVTVGNTARTIVGVPHHIYVGRNLTWQNKQVGFWTKTANDVLFSENTTYGHRPGNSTGGAGMGFQYDPQRVWFLFNESYDNTFGMSSGSGNVGGRSDVYLIGNLIHDNLAGGIQLNGDVGGDYVVSGNTLFNNPIGIENGYYQVSAVMSNNIIAQSATRHIAFRADYGSGAVSDVRNSLFDSPARIEWDGVIRDVAGLQSIGECAGCRTGEPLFVNPAAGDYRLQAQSPAIDGGVLETAYATFQQLYGIDIRVDKNRVARPQGSAWDIGAFEFNPDGIVQPPVCGNNLIEGTEQCDGTVGNNTCASRGFTGGTLACTASCTFNISQCTNLPPADLTPPLISNVTATNLTTTTATITWTTDEPATTRADYGFTASYGQTSPLVSTLTITHTVTLTNLSPNSTYHYRVRSEDGAPTPNQAESPDFTFLTLPVTPPDTTPPQTITDLKTATIEAQSATLTFTAPDQDAVNPTARPVTSYDLRYGPTPLTDANWSTATQASGEPTPSLPGQPETYTLVDLTPSQTYSVAIKSQDSAGNLSRLSNVLTFTTPAEPQAATGDTGGNTSNSGGGGGGGGSGGSRDTVPPQPPTLATVRGANRQAILKWQNPVDPDFVRVLVLRSLTLLPVGVNPRTLLPTQAPPLAGQATIIYDGTVPSFTDTNLSNGQLYYYTLYAYDRSGNYSKPLTLSTIPVKDELVGRQALILQLMRRLLELLQQLLALVLRGR